MERIAVVSWAPGGNLPPLLAAASLMAERGRSVSLLASGATRSHAAALGLDVHTYARAPDPDTTVAFEHQAETMLAQAAGAEVAGDVRDLLREIGAALTIVDCMLPAGVAGAQAAGARCVSLVHFAYGLARRVIAGGDPWTTDLDTLDSTRRGLGLAPAGDALTAWEAVDLLLVSAPRWFDVDAGFPAHVVHAGPLGVRTTARPVRHGVLLSFSTTVMDGQPELLQRAVDAVARIGVDATLTLGGVTPAAALSVPPTLAVSDWDDHDALLAHCEAVVTHGGLGTTLRALAHGVPLVVLPLGRDQAFNAAQVSELGAGIALDAGADTEAIRHALQRVLSEPAYSDAAAKVAARIAAEEPDATAAAVLTRLLGDDA